MEAALRTEQRRVQEWYAQYGAASAAADVGAPGKNNGLGDAILGGSSGDKKRDDAEGMAGSHGWDPESAALHGASTTFQPMAGLIRGRGGRCTPALTPMLGVLQLADRCGLALYKRPVMRGLFTLYLLMLHFVMLVMML